MTTINQNPNQINLDDAEDWKLPTAGVHDGLLDSFTFGPTKAGDAEQYTIKCKFAENDPDTPNATLSYYVGWPTPADKEVMWGTRTAYGAKVKAIQELMRALGGPETGPIDRKRVDAQLTRSVGKKVKMQVRISKSKETEENMANISKLLPA